MATQFKPKQCRQCPNHVSDTETLCSFCQDKAVQQERRFQQRVTVPVEPIVECLLRPGMETSLTVTPMTYRFIPNEDGRSICTITNPAHYQRITQIPGYMPYVAASDAVTNEDGQSELFSQPIMPERRRKTA